MLTRLWLSDENVTRWPFNHLQERSMTQSFQFLLAGTFSHSDNALLRLSVLLVLSHQSPSPWSGNTFSITGQLWGEIRETHDGVIKWKYFPRYWPFVRGIHRSPVNSPHKGQWRGALMYTLICARINGEAGDLRRYRGHYDVSVMSFATSMRWWVHNNNKSITKICVVFRGFPAHIRPVKQKGFPFYEIMCIVDTDGHRLLARGYLSMLG